MDLIEPDHFDAVVITSGLPEVLIASALARAGQSVLVLDAADSYGASWSSLSGTDFVHHLMNRHLERGSQSPLHSDAAHALQNQELAQQQTASATPTTVPPQNADTQDDRHPALVQMHSVRPLVNLCGSAALYMHATVEQLLENRQLIIDLAPRVVYQDESLVQLLVSCQAHNYLEFKLVEGSYIYQSGRLRPVPASRADLFADKSLSLADKHSLGRFLTACMEAQQGFGRLKGSFGSRPLVDLLASEGLSQTLQEVVLYGIAMADTPQQQRHTRSIDARPAGADLAARASSSDNNSSSSSSSDGGRQPREADLLPACEGLAALQLYTASLGKHGGKGAFMAPCYGCGSVPEAFVRLAAVKGAVTALRHAAEELKLLPASQQEQEQPQQLEQQDQQQDQAEHGNSIPADSTASGPAPGRSTVSRQSAAAGITAAAARVQVKLTSGQSITANAVIGCFDAFDSDFRAAGSLSGASAASTVLAANQSPSCSSAAAHAVALLDSSIVDDDSSLLLVFPPGSLDPEQTAVIRGLQFGPAMAVTPSGKYLLYLTAVLPQHMSSTAERISIERGSGTASSNAKEQHSSLCKAEQVLRPAIDALLCAEGLEALSSGQQASQQHQQEVEQEQPAISGAAAGRHAAAADDDLRSQQHQQPSVRQKPQVLALCYYTIQQPAQQVSLQQQRPQQLQSSQQQQLDLIGTPVSTKQPDPATLLKGDQSSPVLLCPSAPPGYTGYDAVIHSTEAAYRQHFPGRPWLTDQVRPKASPSASSTAAGPEESHKSAPGAGPGGWNTEPVADRTLAAAADVDDDNDAIDELTAALAELAAFADPGK